MGKRGAFAVALAATALATRAQENVGSPAQQPVTQQAPAQQPAAAQQAPAQQPVAQAPRGGASAAGTSDQFERACVDLLNGRMPQDEKAISTLRTACADLITARAEERIQQTERQQAQAMAAQQPQPGTQGAASVQEGQGVRASFEQAGRELTGSQRTQAMGFRTRGPVGTTVVSNPIGWFNGLGMNAEFFRSFQPKLSWVAGARYSSTDASNGEATTFGALAGIDWFAFGRNNEGFRVGPRLELSAGREEFQGDTTFARLGLGGELGYNFIATNGLTALLAGGMGGRVAGDDENEDFASFVGGEFGPYVKLGLGFSW